MTIYNLQPRNVYNSGYTFLAHKTSKYEKLGWEPYHTMIAYQFISPDGKLIHCWDRYTLIFYKRIMTCQAQ